MPSVLVMPRDAPAMKMAAASDYQRGRAGSEIVLYDRMTEDRAAICARIAAERGMTMVPPYDHADVMAGQGTVAFELIGQVGPLDALLVCLGGGGLLSGCAVAAHYLLPDIAIYGVEPAAGNDVQQSVASGHIVKITVPQTIADGAQTTSCGELTFPVIKQLVRDVVTVTDDELVETMRVLAQRIKQVVEPTGCLAAAALLTRKIDLRGQRVGVVLSGGNVDLPRYARFLQGV
jgi:threo-3-hydroxy-L-aspartate ammonia-lyase